MSGINIAQWVSPGRHRQMIGGRAGAGLLSVVLVLAHPAVSPAEAKPRAKLECKSSGPPGQLEANGPFETMQMFDYASEHWVVTIDRPYKPKNIEIVSQSGVRRTLGKPPPVRPTAWFGRGTAIYAVGIARGGMDGTWGVVSLRWSRTGGRPRLTRLWEIASGEVRPTAVLVGDTLAVAWADKLEDGTSHWTIGFVDMDRDRIGEKQSLGHVATKVSGHLKTAGKGFVSVWRSDDGVYLARFDGSGKITRPATPLSGPLAPAITAVAQCGDNLYALAAPRPGDARLLLVDGATTSEIRRFKSPLVAAEMQLTCTTNAAVVGRRTYNAKKGSIVFWISTIDAQGQGRDRRIKDTKGKPDAITRPRVVGTGENLSAWWLQKEGRRTYLYTRRVTCR